MQTSLASLGKILLRSETRLCNWRNARASTFCCILRRFIRLRKSKQHWHSNLLSMVSAVLHLLLKQDERLCVLREYANNVGELEQAAYRRLHRILVSASWSNSSVLWWHKSKLHKRCQVSRESLKVQDALGGVFDAKSERLSFDSAHDMMLAGLRVFVCVESAVDGKYWHVWWWTALRAVDNNFVGSC